MIDRITPCVLALPRFCPRCDMNEPCRRDRRKVKSVRIWVSDYGEIRLPDNFPLYVFRNNGWWDMRFTAVREKWEAWITAQEAKLRGPIPLEFNRLHGAAINAEGCAI